MSALAAIDWGAVVLALFVLAFLFLVVRAVRRMGTGRDYGSDDGAKAPGKKSRPGREKQPRRTQKPDDAAAAPPLGDGGTAPSLGKGKGRAKLPPKKTTARTPGDVSARTSTRPTEVPPEGPSERERLSKGLAKTRGGFVSRLGKLFSAKSAFDETMLEEVEEVLFTADIGTHTANDLIQSIRREFGKKAGNDPSAVWAHLKRRSAEMLSLDTNDFSGSLSSAHPFVLLVVGVNGTGKTTTIGKLAAHMQRAGHRVLLAAADTFRAAATEQLRVWGERSGVEVVGRGEGADPAAVVVDALKKAKAEGYDVVICDTAGRLHTKVSLMEELEKIPRAIAKHSEGGPHETFLVLDATTGQNAITQAKIFGDAIKVTGLVLTKLDGTAKGGVVLGICNELKLPIRFVGIGERVDDLRVFDPDAFVEALFERDETEAE